MTNDERKIIGFDPASGPDKSVLYYVPHDGKTIIMPDGRMIRLKSRSQGVSTMADKIAQMLTRYKLESLYPAQRQVFVSQRDYQWLQAVQSIVHRWWRSLGIDQYESERIERMNRWARQ